MHIDVTLGSALVRYLPENYSGNRLRVECGIESTLSELLSNLGIENEQPLLVILNGAVINKQAYSSTSFSENDALSLMPPIQAG